MREQSPVTLTDLARTNVKFALDRDKSTYFTCTVQLSDRKKFGYRSSTIYTRYGVARSTFDPQCCFSSAILVRYKVDPAAVVARVCARKPNEPRPNHPIKNAHNEIFSSGQGGGVGANAIGGGGARTITLFRYQGIYGAHCGSGGMPHRKIFNLRDGF